METLQCLGIALGLASLAGLNLYLTVFVTGLAIQQHWIDVATTHPDLMILAHPAVLAVSGVLYLLEFFADKIPWVDSLWDAVHTVIRPIGGALLAIRVLGNPDPVFDVIVALLGGGASLLVHAMKAGTRLIVNHSPEPFSNIGLSLVEDLGVIGGLALIRHDAVLALAVFSLALLAICYFGPKLYRAAKVQLWLVWKKIGSPASDRPVAELTATLPAEIDVIFHTVNLAGEKIVWAAPCVSGSARGIPGNIFGYLIATAEQPAKVWFVARRGWRKLAVELDLLTYKVAHEPKFLSENLVLYSLEKKPKYLFVFSRTQSARGSGRCLAARAARHAAGRSRGVCSGHLSGYSSPGNPGEAVRHRSRKSSHFRSIHGSAVFTCSSVAAAISWAARSTFRLIVLSVHEKIIPSSASRKPSRCTSWSKTKFSGEHFAKAFSTAARRISSSGASLLFWPASVPTLA
jgi:Domain of unknown function (DUF4126)